MSEPIKGFKSLEELRMMVAQIQLEDKDATVIMKNETFHKYLDMIPEAKRAYYDGKQVKAFGMEVKIA